MATVLSAPAIYRFLDEEPPSLALLTRRYRFLANGVSPDLTERWLTWILFDSEKGPVGFTQATILPDNTAHIAYVLSPACWGQGYAQEAVSALLCLLFESLHVYQAVAEIDARNQASIALANRLHFELSGSVSTSPGHSELRFVLSAASWLHRSR